MARSVRFSERMGRVTPAFQRESMDEPLRSALWNITYGLFWEELDSYYRASDAFGGQLLFSVAVDHLYFHADDFSRTKEYAIAQVKRKYFALEWWGVYDFIEFVAKMVRGERDVPYAGLCNGILGQHLSAYRFVAGRVAPIISDEEIAEVEQALSQGGKFAPAAEHLKTALARLADLTNPDYRNSIKESISAVESACQIITGDSNATLGQALKKLDVHRALESGFSKIHGYTSNAEGIRHAMLEESSVDADDARFFLVSCSAFVNYLITKSGA